MATRRFRRPASSGRQAGEELDERPFRRLAEPQVGQDARRARDDEAADFRLGQTGQVGPVVLGQGPAATASAFRVDRNAGHRERFHVAIDRSHRDLQSLREDAGRETPVGLEEEQDREEAVGAHVDIQDRTKR